MPAVSEGREEWDWAGLAVLVCHTGLRLLLQRDGLYCGEYC